MSLSGLCTTTQPAKPDLSQDMRVKCGVLCATLILLVRMLVRSWGKWYTLFGVTLAPFVIVAAWFHRRRRLSAWSLIPALLQATLGYCIVWGPQIWSSAESRTFDIYLFSVDGSFGFEPSIWLRHAVDQVHLFWFFKYVYICLPLAMAAAYVAHLSSRKRLLYIPVVLGVVSLAGLLLYQILPACGPIYLLGKDGFAGRFDFSASRSVIARMTTDNSLKSKLYNSALIDTSAPRNAMPSLHVTWALLVFWICRDLRRGRWIAGAFLICTALSTLAVGEHYLVDVIVAFPFALIVWQVCVGEGSFGNPRRVLSIMGGGLMLLLWLASIRIAPQAFWLSPILPWSAAFTTVGGSLWAVSRHPDEWSVSSEDQSEVRHVTREEMPELVEVD